MNLGADSYINKNGSPETVYCELADAISKTFERKKSRELLAKSESKYHALVENSLQGISILQATPIRIVFANDAMGKILGYSAEELKSLSPEGIMSLVYQEDRAVFFKRMEDRLRGEAAEACYEFRAVRKDGSIIWLSSLANRVDYDGQPAVQGMFLDVNERKKAEEVVTKSEVRYRELANFLPEIVFETDLSGKITFLSQTAFEITGFTPEDKEKGINMLQFVVPEDRERAKENIRRRMAREKTDTSEYTLFRKNGETYPAIVKTAPIYSENRLTGLRGLVIDITDRKKAEEAMIRSMDGLVLVNEKLNVVGSLTRHDVRNKLLAVTGNAFLLKKKHPDQTDIVTGLGKIEQACKEIGTIFDFAKMYEQLGVEKLTYIDVEKTLNEALALFSGSLNVKVLNDCHGLILLADSFLRQLFFNLMDNSAKHGEKVTTIKVTYEKADKDSLNLIYEDDGIGIPVQNKGKLFKEGFSTGGSSGYGLYLIRKMIEVYGWAIQENGEPAKGAKFTITIPKINQKGKENFQIA